MMKLSEKILRLAEWLKNEDNDLLVSAEEDEGEIEKHGQAKKQRVWPEAQAAQALAATPLRYQYLIMNEDGTGGSTWGNMKGGPDTVRNPIPFDPNTMELVGGNMLPDQHLSAPADPAKQMHSQYKPVHAGQEKYGLGGPQGLFPANQSPPPTDLPAPPIPAQPQGQPAQAKPQANYRSPAGTVFSPTQQARTKEAQKLFIQWYGAQCLGPSGADGKLGPFTEAAINKFQEKHTIPRTGQLDDLTWEHIDKAARNQPKTAQLRSFAQASSLKPYIDALAKAMREYT